MREFQRVFSPKWFAEISHLRRSFGDLDGGKMLETKYGYDVRASHARFVKAFDIADLIFGIQKNFMDSIREPIKLFMA